MKSILLLTVLLAACGAEERDPPKTALCKTLKDGTVQRYEISLQETDTRAVMKSMGFEPCY